MPGAKQKQKVTVQKPKHIPVLLSEVLQYLAPQRSDTYLDATAGYGGHAAAVLEASQASATLVDRDQLAINTLKQQFTGQGIEIINADFLSASRRLLTAGRQYDMVLADLGVSSPHLDNASRGFSFKDDAPLDMRMDQSQALTAGEIVNSYSAEALTSILRDYGEEPKAARLASEIAANRPITTTSQLADLAKKVWPGYSRVHPATRLFQALRIAVNDELAQLEQALPIWVELLAPGGRLAIISFHSLEDRLVKKFLAEAGQNSYDAPLKVLTKHPVTASSQELVFNPRSRSAKLRAAVKIKMKGK